MLNVWRLSISLAWGLSLGCLWTSSSAKALASKQAELSDAKALLFDDPRKTTEIAERLMKGLEGSGEVDQWLNAAAVAAEAA